MIFQLGLSSHDNVGFMADTGYDYGYGSDDDETPAEITL